ncbi:amidase signature enzyme [Podospora aff. communis PSN243]|uniref:Amidase signature enzyme n=1 Tax=Podospora aff. communis PSN243 TaxID=3040156 RepID=A0AAV9GD70_9PEZI|nr:amidase signature enzyme [Podospora aff. communis PSN243]
MTFLSTATDIRSSAFTRGRPRATTLADGLHLGWLTTVDLTKAYLARIDEASDFNAVLQINPDALSAAQKLDEERKTGTSRGPLHGIPILVKDNIVTADNLDASAGSFALLGAKPSNESSLIAKLRKAGVLILGKTNMSEWANFRGLSISSGWSPRGGQTMGAYYPNSTPEGSSSGSAVATALGLSTAAIGTETFGSILEPAEFNNVVGLKPSRGLIANDSVIPISARKDVIGTLSQAGAKVVDANFKEAEGFKKLNQQIRGIVRSSEFKRDIDIIEFTKTFPGEEYPDRDIGKFLWTQEEGIDVDSDKYHEMVRQEQFYGGAGGILGAMETYNLDLLVVPSSLGIANDLAAKMGFPVMGVPLGFYPEGTPIELDKNEPHLVRVAPRVPYSLTLISKAFSDGVLIQVGYAFEQLSSVRRNGPLQFKSPSTELRRVSS